MIKRTAIFLLLLFPIFYVAVPSFAMTREEKNFLLMYFKPDELKVIAATRSLKSISRVAENVEVVTASDIELMNAHTVGEVLSRINGVQVLLGGSGFGRNMQVLIEGSDAAQVVVMLDGIRLNNLSTDNDEIGSIPVQFIDRIEVIKGSASSVWGSSLGGVINIITKGPGTKEKPGGTVQASYGERTTSDVRAEVQGKKEGFGYYFSAGNLSSDGFYPDDQLRERNLYTTLSYDLGRETDLQFKLFYNKARRGRGRFTDYDVSTGDNLENLLTGLHLRSRLNSEFKLDAALDFASQNVYYSEHLISTGEESYQESSKGKKYEAHLAVTWNRGPQAVVAGAELKNDILQDSLYGPDKLKVTKSDFFVNDTITLGPVTVTPGLRFDDTSRTDMFVSPSIGVTYNIGHHTLLRALVARGFNDPSLTALRGTSPWYRPNPDLGRETVWSYQAGFETGVLKYLWLKVEGFRHEIRDIIVSSDLVPDGSVWTFVNGGRARREGVEVEMKTVPVYNLTLAAGTSYIHTKDLDTGEEIRDVPTNTYNVALTYDDKSSFRARLDGRYIWWNMEDYYDGRYGSMIFDVNVIKTLYQRKGLKTEVFATGHNIFDGSQYWTTPYVNARRWFEAGLRMKF